MSQLQLLISEPALQDLSELYSYVATDNPNAADELVDKIYELCERLTTMPKLGKTREELAIGLRSFPAKNYNIYYRISTESIEVVRILHNRRDISSQF